MGGRGTQSKRITIGKHGPLTPDEARKVAKGELGKVARGMDIAQAKKDQRNKLSGLTFKETVERYLAVRAKDTRYWRMARTRLKSADVKAIQDRPIALITRAQIAAVIDTVQGRSNASARLLFKDMSPIFAWALNRAAVESNPMGGMRGPPPSQPRDRFLSDEEIKAFWQAASEQNWPFKNVFKLLLLTGQRRGEVGGMRWRELDFDNATWTIAKERCKNGKAHTIDLSPEVLRILDPVGDAVAFRPTVFTQDFVFSTSGTVPVSGFHGAKERIDKRMHELVGEKFQPWRTHDLRRTAASGMAALGIQPHVIERVLNHLSGVQGGLTGVYQRYEYREERKQAILIWSEHVAHIVGREAATSIIVPLKK
jgi:integrase